MVGQVKRREDRLVRTRIHFFGPIRGLVKNKEQFVVLEEGPTVRRLLDELGRANGAEFRRYLVLEGATVNPALVVFVNGESLDEILNLDAPLTSGARVDVMLASPILGG